MNDDNVTLPADEPRIRAALLEFLRSGDNELLSEDDDMPALWPGITLDGDGLLVEIRGEGGDVAARYRVTVEPLDRPSARSAPHSGPGA